MLLKTKRYLKSIPLYGLIMAIVLFGMQYAIYRLGWFINVSRGGLEAYHWIPKLPFDDSIPLIPFFVIFYVFSYVYWFLTFLLSSRTHKPDYYNFLITITLSMIVGFIIFISIPTYMDRNSDPYIIEMKNKPGFLYDLLRLIYSSDGEGIAYCMFPSYHCLLACCGFLGMFRKKEFKLSTQIIYFILLICICASTIFTKQHYFIDIIGGLTVAIVVYVVVQIINPGSKIYLHQIKKTLNR